MKKETLELANGSAIELEVGSGLHNMRVLFDTEEDMISVWKSLTEENLRSVKIKDSDGKITGVYADLVLESETSVRGKEKISTSFNLREKTDIEKRVDGLEEKGDIHEGAIGDLGKAVSKIAEGSGS